MLFYLVSIAGFPPLLASGLLTAALLWDGVADAGIAWWTDRHGRGQALDRPVAIALAIILCRLGYSMCDIGHNTLLVRVARTERDASIASGIRLIFSAIGAALVAFASGWSLSLVDRVDQQTAFATGAAIGGGLYIATLFAAIAATRRIAPVASPTATIRRPFSLRALFARPPFRRTLLLAAVQAGMVPLFLRALPFFGESVHGSAAWAGPALVSITLAQSLSLPVWITVSRWHAPARLGMAAHGLMLLATIGLAIGSDGWAGSAWLILAGVAQGGMNMALWALLALGIHHSIVGGSSSEAVPVGLFLATLKIASAGSSLLLATLVSRASGALLAAIALAVPLGGCAIALGLLSRWAARPAA